MRRTRFLLGAISGFLLALSVMALTIISSPQGSSLQFGLVPANSVETNGSAVTATAPQASPVAGALDPARLGNLVSQPPAISLLVMIPVVAALLFGLALYRYSSKRAETA